MALSPPISQEQRRRQRRKIPQFAVVTRRNQCRELLAHDTLHGEKLSIGRNEVKRRDFFTRDRRGPDTSKAQSATHRHERSPLSLWALRSPLCRLTGWNRSSLQYRPEGRDDATLRERLRYWASLKPRWGAPILPDVLKAEGLVINHRRTERLYREEGLSLRRKRRRKLPAVARVSLSVPQGPNERWSMDFIHDQLATVAAFAA